MKDGNRTIIDHVDKLMEAIGAMRKAQQLFATYSQEQVDKIFKAAAIAANKARIPLAKMAVEETGMGVVEDKVIKNNYAAEYIYNAYKDTKTCGVIEEDKAFGTQKIAEPIGVIAAVIPTTNPTSTAIFKCLLALKTRNAIIISPHPRAKGCTIAAAKLVLEAAVAAGAPEGIIDWIDVPSLEMTNTVMKEADIILATGGPGMVKAAYSSGKPALGVGAGNTPAIIDDTADILLAVSSIIHSKTFDNGTICASEQSIITQECIKRQVVEEMKRQHCYFMNADETDKVGRFIMRANNTMNPAIVGKTAQDIAKMAGIQIPSDTLILVAETSEVGKKNPYSREKLCPILAFFTVKNWEEACDKSIEILENEGTGHTMTIHSNDEEIIKQFGLRKPVSRVLVNVAASLGGVGALTGLTPALTLGCGAVGGSASSDNIGPLNLMNIRRVAYGTMELEDLRREAAAVTSSVSRTPTTGNYGNYSDSSYKAPKPQLDRPEQKLESNGEITQTQIEAITKEVLREILANR
mgnify:CR=1 FL=1